MGFPSPRIVCHIAHAPNACRPIQVAIKGGPQASQQYFTYQVSACPGCVPTQGDCSKKGQRLTSG